MNREAINTVTSGDTSRSLMDSLPLTIGDWTRIGLRARRRFPISVVTARFGAQVTRPHTLISVLFLTETNVLVYFLLWLSGILIFLKEDSNWREKNGSIFPQWKLDHSWGKAASEGAPGVGTADPQATTARLRGPRPQWSMGAAWQVSLGHRTTRSTCRSCSVEDAGSDD